MRAEEQTVAKQTSHMKLLRQKPKHPWLSKMHPVKGVVRWCEGIVFLASPGHPTDIGLQLGKTCYPYSR